MGTRGYLFDGVFKYGGPHHGGRCFCVFLFCASLVLCEFVFVRVCFCARWVGGARLVWRWLCEFVFVWVCFCVSLVLCRLFLCEFSFVWVCVCVFWFCVRLCLWVVGHLSQQPYSSSINTSQHLTSHITSLHITHLTSHTSPLTAPSHHPHPTTSHLNITPNHLIITTKNNQNHNYGNDGGVLWLFLAHFSLTTRKYGEIWDVFSTFSHMSRKYGGNGGYF